MSDVTAPLSVLPVSYLVGRGVRRQASGLSVLLQQPSIQQDAGWLRVSIQQGL